MDQNGFNDYGSKFITDYLEFKYYYINLNANRYK